MGCRQDMLASVESGQMTHRLVLFAGEKLLQSMLHVGAGLCVSRAAGDSETAVAVQAAGRGPSGEKRLLLSPLPVPGAVSGALLALSEAVLGGT